MDQPGRRPACHLHRPGRRSSRDPRGRQPHVRRPRSHLVRDFHERGHERATSRAHGAKEQVARRYAPREGRREEDASHGGALMRRALPLLAAVLLAPLSARAEEPNEEYASFALIVGVNKSVDADVAQLRYADDDAARYLDLFRSLGARSYVLTRPDANTRRLHPQVAAEAMLPVKS